MTSGHHPRLQFIFSLSVLSALLACDPNPVPPAGDAAVDAGQSQTDAQQSDAAQICQSADTCASGLGCVDGACASCQSGEDCRASLRQGCDDGVCGPCTDPSQCATGLGCRAVTEECADCRNARECRPGEGCHAGLCSTCNEASDCSGGLCINGTCVACQPGDDDSACQQAYHDDGFSCRVDGVCAPNLCASGLDCVFSGEVCDLSNARCAACTSSAQCVAEGSGGYAAGTSCIEGHCVEANCVDSQACPEDRPICGDAFRCRSCQLDQECLDHQGVDSGFICDLTTGRCAAGDCYPAGGACGEEAAGQICGDDFVCGACDNNSRCDQAYSSNHLCMDGHCQVAQCNDELTCTNNRICQAGLCVDCTDEAQDFCLASGEVCDAETNTCVECIDDSNCTGGARLCENNRCRDCGSGECGDGRVCISGLCVVGECSVDNQENPYNPCQFCDGGNHLWVNKPQGTGCGVCKTCEPSPPQSEPDAGRPDSGEATEVDMSCQFVPAGEDPKNSCDQNCRVCDGYGGCTFASVGTDPNDDCLESSISTCGFNGLCQGGNGNCAYWTGGVGQVNDSNPCTSKDYCDGAGNKTGQVVEELTWCEGGHVCKSGECVPCNTGECGLDAVCESGLCRGGDCTSASTCPGDPAICYKWDCVANHCTQVADNGASCESGNPCTIDDYCLDGTCQEKASPTLYDCGSTTATCTDMVCHNNNGSVDCQEGSANESGSCTYSSENPSGDICHAGICQGGSCDEGALLGGFCYIDGACYSQGTVNPDYSCAYCNASSNPTNWSTSSDQCLIDGQCYQAGDTDPTEPECQYCGSNDLAWTQRSVDTSCNSTRSCEQRCVGGACRDRWETIDRCVNAGLLFVSCIQDNVTHLRWTSSLNHSCPTSAPLSTLRDAGNSCASLGSYWRLPSASELESIVSTDSTCSVNMCPSTPSHSLRASPLFKNKLWYNTYYWAVTTDRFGNALPTRLKYTGATSFYIDRNPSPTDEAIGWCVRDK